jgi:hypothetical protein
MISFITIDLLTGAYNLRAKTNRPKHWKVRVTATQGDVKEVYTFELKRACALSSVREQLSTLVWTEIRELQGRSFDSVTCEVGV